MQDPIKLHQSFQALGINEATIHALAGDYYYIAISPTEFQFGLESQPPVNYTV